jgi:hypothetical protein
MNGPNLPAPSSAQAIRLVQAALVLWLAVAMYTQSDVGLADQGDFARASSWCTYGPTGLLGPYEIDSPEYLRRYFQDHLPYWESQTFGLGPTLRGLGDAKTSTAYLWLPGVLFNRCAYSSRVLHLPVVSLLPRLLMVGFLFGLFTWIDAREPRHKLGLLVLLGVPLALMLSTTDCLAYLNSFYQETGSLVYLGLWIASLVFVRHRPESLTRGVLSFGALALLICSKASNVYWIILGLPFLFFLRHRWQWSPRPAVRLTAYYAALSAVLLIAYIFGVYHADLAPRHNYNRLFYGILTFSEDPRARLTELGLEDSVSCVGHTAFTPRAGEFLAQHSSQISPLSTLRVAWAEPAAMLRMLKFAADNMQDLSVDDLGQRTAFDPRPRLAPIAPSDPNFRVSEQRWWQPASTRLLNLWSFVKFHAFPTGGAFLLAIAVYIAVFAALRRKEGLLGDLANIGLMTSLGCIVDACVAIGADGRTGLIKHLFLANLLFDVATIALLGVVGLAIPRRRGKNAATASQ